MSKAVYSLYKKIFISNNHGLYQVTLANDANNIEIEFLRTKTIKRVTKEQIETGSVSDHMYPTVCGVGCIGTENFNRDGWDKHCYEIWSSMIDRCYGENQQREQCKHYEDVVISDDFLNFSKFRTWYNKQPNAHRKGFHLDKDALSDGVLMYSKDTCTIIPLEINIFLTTRKIKGDKQYPVGVSYVKGFKKFKSACHLGEKGQYYKHFDNEWEAFLDFKRVKEQRAKDLAEKWKYDIDKRVYDKLINFKVLPTF